MSTTLNCPDCDEKVTLKPGKSSVKCPACGTSISADDRPAARGGRRRDDDDDDDDRKEKKKSKRKYREEWDDDDDDDERKPPPKPKSSLTWLWILLIVLGAVLAGCIGLGWWVVTMIGQAKQNFQQKFDQDRQRMEQQMNAGPGNPQGRPKAPAQKDASEYPKKKLFEVDPQLTTKPSPVYLDDLEPFDVRQGPWPIGRHGAFGYDGRWVVVDKVYYDHGIGMHPPDRGPARISFAVGGQARRFRGSVALNDNTFDSEIWDPVTFAIYKDGKEVWRSAQLKRQKGVLPFDIDVTGARVIMLETNATGGSHDAHCVWLDPVLEK